MSRPRPPPDFSRRIRSAGPDETRALGVRLGELLEPGHFVGLVGDLGAGKTHLVRGVAEGAKVDRTQVASPTFAIVYPYEGGRVPLAHADLYRLADYDELYATGFMDLIGGGSALLVEWIDKIWDAAPAELLLVTIAFVPGADEGRVVHVDAWGPRHVALAEAWVGAGVA